MADCRYLPEKALAALMDLDHVLAKGHTVFSVELGQPYTWKEASADLNRLSNHDLQAICAQKHIPAPPTKADKVKRIIEFVHRLGVGTCPLQVAAVA